MVLLKREYVIGGWNLISDKVTSLATTTEIDFLLLASIRLPHVQFTSIEFEKSVRLLIIILLIRSNFTRTRAIYLQQILKVH